MGNPFENEYLHSFDYSNCELPDVILFPHNYQPHKIAKKASKELQRYLNNHSSLHDFENSLSEGGGGKMFGVLVVQKQNSEIGYLASFSGKLGGKTSVPGFVPPIFDLLDTRSYFLKEEERITALNLKYDQLVNSEKYLFLKRKLEQDFQSKEKEISNFKSQILVNKKARQEIRNKTNDENEIALLNHQSALEKIELKNLKNKWDKKLEEQKTTVAVYENEIKQVENLRSELSSQLQQKIFESYKLINSSGEEKNMLETFKEFNNKIPPAASGECAAPKLFQFAYLNKYTPIALAEFWWGENPNREIRKHQHFYPACKSKCEPILNFMLQGLNVESDPLSQKLTLPYINVLYDDEYLLVIDKPSGLLSVPGKTNANSVSDWVNTTYPNSSEFSPVHRLDRDTSGILIIAKDLKSSVSLQKQFLNREVKKEYYAILDGILHLKQGIIDLPLRPDLEDRPRQMVCYEHGKGSITEFKVIKIEDNKTRIRFNPLTGRTHQLRLHASHSLGLNTPIVGDPLYGKPDKRLMLHASKIEFTHPETGIKITIESKEPF